MIERLKQAVVRLSGTPASQRQRLPVLEQALSPVLSAGALVFAWLRQLRILLYKWRVLRQHRLPLPVLSVGNLTWGGSGKTSMVEFLSRRFIGAGIRPLVLTRGYGGGDEARLLATHLLPYGEVGCGADRAKVCNRILREQGLLDPEELHKLVRKWHALGLEVDLDNQPCPAQEMRRVGVVILDDGLQQWSLVKDLEVVMVNAISLWGNGHMVPRGPLREPVQELRRADVVVIHHADLVRIVTCKCLYEDLVESNTSSHSWPPFPAKIPACRLESILASVKTEALILYSQMAPKHFSKYPLATTGLHSASNLIVPLNRVKGEVVLCVSGIGCPESLFLVLKQLGALHVAEMTFSDHHQFTHNDVRRMGKVVSKLQDKYQRPVLLVITEKDYMRDPLALAGLKMAEIFVLHSTLKIMDESTCLSRLDDLLVKVACGPLHEEGFPACQVPSQYLNRKSFQPA